MSKEQDGRNDFDFFIGSWKGYNRRLRERLKGSNDWEEFEGKSVARKILSGMGNIDEVSMDRESGILQGFTLRLFDPKSEQWSIYWADSLRAILLSPMVGSFKNGRGEFYDQEPFESKRIFSRFVWLVNSDTSCRWEQAFSADGGKTWETNWTTDFKRI
jgi:hypothetical protein